MAQGTDLSLSLRPVSLRGISDLFRREIRAGKSGGKSHLGGTGKTFPYRRLVAIIARLPDRPEATVEYFVPDDRKAGGAFVSVTGRVRHISVPERTLVMEDGTVIPLDDVVSVASEIF